MKVTKIKITLLFLFVSFTVVAQNNTGIAFYKEIVKKSEKSNEVAEIVKQILTKQINKAYILIFNSSESLYKIENTLDKPNSSFFGLAFDDKTYQNLKTSKKIIEREIFGKLFLIKEDLSKKDWTITGEKKKIGNYNCILAKTIEQIKVDDELIINNISAWFTAELPYSHGPNGYFGLPGLILELSNNTTTLYCYKIQFNTKNKIKKPKKGEVVTQKKFDSIIKHKTLELIKDMSK